MLARCIRFCYIISHSSLFIMLHSITKMQASLIIIYSCYSSKFYFSQFFIIAPIDQMKILDFISNNLEKMGVKKPDVFFVFLIPSMWLVCCLQYDYELHNGSKYVYVEILHTCTIVKNITCLTVIFHCKIICKYLTII
jgi:hypothetical protein